MKNNKEKKLVEDARLLWKYLDQNREHWKSAKEIKKDIGLNERRTREASRVAIEFNQPIATGNEGYILTHDWNKLLRSARRIYSGAQEMLERANKLKNIATEIKEKYK